MGPDIGVACRSSGENMVRELGVDFVSLGSWFSVEQHSPYVLVRVADEHARAWSNLMGLPIRRCYVADSVLVANAQRTGWSRTDLVSAKLPGPGSTMAGDFGEILVAMYQAAHESPMQVIDPKKWRLKQDPTKPAPLSDVVQFVVPTWPKSSDQDRLLCSEVKTKSTRRTSSPIIAAIADSKKDRVERLSKTLVWLRKRALLEDLGTMTIDHLQRFINLTDHPPVRKEFRAVAVVCTSLLEAELASAPDAEPKDYSVVVIAVPELKQCYEATYRAVLAAAEI
jgi:hypothetical protein